MCGTSWRYNVLKGDKSKNFQKHSKTKGEGKEKKRERNKEEVKKRKKRKRKENKHTIYKSLRFVERLVVQLQVSA